MKRRLFSVLVILTLVMGLVPASVLAAPSLDVLQPGETVTFGPAARAWPVTNTEWTDPALRPGCAVTKASTAPPGTALTCHELALGTISAGAPSGAPSAFSSTATRLA